MSFHLCDSLTQEKLDSNYTNFLSPKGNLINLKNKQDFEINSSKHTLWRYRKAIPIQNDNCIVSMNEGYTALTKIQFKNGEALIKQEQLFSTGSYKDRGASVLISRVKEIGVTEIVQDSSGNAGCAIAAYAALAGITCHIYLPSDTSDAKVAQMRAYGANIIRVEGDREATALAAKEAAQKIYYASHCYNPWFFEGTKTFAFELCEQLNWRAPDAVVVPAGNGTLVIGCQIGFNQLFAANRINKIPKIIAIQSANCAALAQMFDENLDEIPKISKQTTLAEGIAIAEPVRAKQIITAVKESKGHFISVSELEIIEALKYTARMGYFIEPTSAATIAGLEKYMSKNKNEIVVSLFSGHGLKSIDKWMKLL